MRLLNRTTRSVSASEAGERLLMTVAPRFEEIEGALARLRGSKDRPSGTIRITAVDYTIDGVLPLLRRYPDIHVEMTVDYGLTDIVAERYDAGVRIGEAIPKDMIAVRLGADFRFAVVGAPDYFALRPAPRTPADLAGHACINMRLPTYGGLYAWELEREGREQRVRVDGQLTFNATGPILAAALDGFGLAYLPEDLVAPQLQSGRLAPALEPWWPMCQGLHLFYPSRRQASPAFAAVVEALRSAR